MPSQTKQMTLHWEGTFLELCMARISRAQKNRIDADCGDFGGTLGSLWYDNAARLKSLFDADHWWAVDDLDHAMGLVFADRAVLDRQLAAITYKIDDVPVTVDPDALQLSFYAPEPLAPLAADEHILCHGARRQAVLRLQVDFEPPFDPTLITLSFLRYPDYGHILIDLDFDGHDDVTFTWGETTYLKPRFFAKDHFHDTSR
jgi:hypothetical protein